MEDKKNKKSLSEIISNFILVIVFYNENNIFKLRAQNRKLVFSFYIFSFYLIIQSLYKLYNFFDIFNFTYLIFGLLFLCYAIKETYAISFKKHKELSVFGYDSMHDFYKRQG